MPISIRIGFVLLALAPACDGAPRAEKPGGPGRPELATSPITARGVELRVPQPGGDVVIAGETLTLGGDRSATLEGDVRLRSEGAMPFEATAARASIASGGRSAVLEGGVRASLSVGLAAGDAGAADD